MMTHSSCTHINAIKDKDNLKTYKIIHAIFVVCASTKARQIKVTLFSHIDFFKISLNCLYNFFKFYVYRELNYNKISD